MHPNVLAESLFPLLGSHQIDPAQEPRQFLGQATVARRGHRDAGGSTDSSRVQNPAFDVSTTRKGRRSPLAEQQPQQTSDTDPTRTPIMITQTNRTRGPLAILAGSILVWTALLIWVVLIGALAGIQKVGNKLASLVSSRGTDKSHLRGKQFVGPNECFPMEVHRDFFPGKRRH